MGPSFAALCHEFGHVCESQLVSPDPDYNHVSWTTNGMWRAIETYQANLKAEYLGVIATVALVVLSGAMAAGGVALFLTGFGGGW